MEGFNLPHAVILGLAYTGYCVVVRSLSLCNIPMIGFESDFNLPEVRTKLCQVRIYKNEDRLLSSLIYLGKKAWRSPALFVASDALVKFCAKNMDRLRKYYQIDLPSKKTINLLLEKNMFTTFAKKHGFRIPKTLIISNKEDFYHCLDEIRTPCVVKPYWRDRNWKNAKFPKIFFFSKKMQLLKKFEIIFSIEKNLIVQEWIPGSDADIYFSLVYYNNKAECIAEFTGRKLRQWPVGLGSTSCAEPVKEDIVKYQTIRLFNLLSYSGFGSVEYKRHSKTGDFYIMEPTVGRPNFQSFLATANGINMPAIAYNSLTGNKVKFSKTHLYPSVWIDDQFDMMSIIVKLFKREINITNILGSYLRKKSFRFLNRKDLKPFIYAQVKFPCKLLSKVIYYCRKLMNR